MYYEREMMVYLLGDLEGDSALIVDIFATPEKAEEERVNLDDAYRKSGFTLKVTPWEVQ